MGWKLLGGRDLRGSRGAWVMTLSGPPTLSSRGWTRQTLRTQQPASRPPQSPVWRFDGTHRGHLLQSDRRGGHSAPAGAPAGPCPGYHAGQVGSPLSRGFSLEQLGAPG